VVAGQFTLTDTDDAEDTGISVTVQPGALLFDQQGNILEPDILAAGLEVRAMGHLLTPEGADSTPELLATAIAVDVDTDDDSETSEEQRIQGSVTAVADGRLDLDAGAEAAVSCVVFDTETSIVVNEVDGEALNTRDGDAEDLEVGRLVEAIGELVETASETCLDASAIIVEAEAET